MTFEKFCSRKTILLFVILAIASLTLDDRPQSNLELLRPDFQERPSPGLMSVKVMDSTARPVEGAEVRVWTINPVSTLMKATLGLVPLRMDKEFSTKQLVVGSTMDRIIFQTYTDADGFAALNITPGLYLLHVLKMYKGYYALVDSFRPGWTMTVYLKPELKPNPEPLGPYQKPMGVSISETGHIASPVPNTSTDTTPDCYQDYPPGFGYYNFCRYLVTDLNWQYLTWNIVHSWYFMDGVYETVTETASQSFLIGIDTFGVTGNSYFYTGGSSTFNSHDALRDLNVPTPYLHDGSYVPVKFSSHLAKQHWYESFCYSGSCYPVSDWEETDVIEIDTVSFHVSSSDVAWYNGADGVAVGPAPAFPSNLAFGPTNGGDHWDVFLGSGSDVGLKVGDKFTIPGVGETSASIKWVWKQVHSTDLSVHYILTNTQQLNYYGYTEDTNEQTHGFSLAFSAYACAPSDCNQSGGDFFLQPSSSSLTLCSTESSCSGTISVQTTSLNRGYSKPVTMSASGLPTGAITSVSPSQVTPPSGGSASSTIQIDASNVPKGTWTVTVSGNDGTYVHITSFQLVVEDNVGPSAPTLSSPLNSATFCDIQTTLTFNWNGVSDRSGIGSYTLQIDTSSGFVQATTRPYSVVGATSKTIPRTDLSSSTWYWRVQAVDNAANQGAWSTVRSFSIPTFCTSFSPAQLDIVQGSSQVSNVQFTSPDGFSGSVSLSSTVTPSGLPYTMSPSSVQLSSGGTATATVNASPTTSTSPTTYTITLTATSGSLITTSTLTVYVRLPLSVSFTQNSGATAGSPVSFTASPAGGTTPYSFSWNFGNGQSGTGNPVTIVYAVKGSYVVTLTLTDNVGRAVISSQTVTVNPTPLIVFPTSSASQITVGTPVTFTASAIGGTAPYSFSWNFGDEATGTGTSISHSYSVHGTFRVTSTITDSNGQTVYASLFITVMDFGVSSDCTSVFIMKGGQSATCHVILDSLDGFSGSVGLPFTVSPVTSNGPIASIIPGSVELSANGQRSADLTISSGTDIGVYNVAITGRSGSLSHTISIPITVCNLSLDSSPGSLTVFTGVRVRTTGCLLVNPTALTVSGTASVLATDDASGTFLFSKTYAIPSMALEGSSNNYHKYFLLNVGGSPYALSSDITVNLSAGTPSASIAVTRNVDIDLSGTVNITDASTVGYYYNCNVGDPCWNDQAARSDLNADGHVNIQDAATVGYYYNAPDFI